MNFQYKAYFSYFSLPYITRLACIVFTEGKRERERERERDHPDGD